MSAEAWDQFVAAHPDGHLLQAADWGRLKSEFGWQAQIVALVDAKGQITTGAQVLYRRLHRLIPLCVGYIPAGPLLPADSSFDSSLWRALDSDARRHGAIFLKVEPCDWYRPRPGLADRLKSGGFRPGAQTIQPPRTIVIDLAGNEEAMLKRMNQSTRYKAKLGPKKEIQVRPGTKADVDRF